MPASAGYWPSNGYSAIGPVLLADMELKKQLLRESKTDMKFVEAKEQQNDSPDRALPSLIDYIALFLWLGWLHVFCITLFFAVVTFPSTLSLVLLAILVTLGVTPIPKETEFTRRFARFITRRAMGYFPIKVMFEDENAIDPAKAYILAAEPHAVLPIGLIGLLSSDRLPNAHLGVTSAIFKVPLLRQVWSWLQLVPANKSDLTALLQAGRTVALVPGGVQECLHIEHGTEVIFLRNRFGFVRLAIETGAPLVPVFCYGQTGVFQWWKPKGRFVESIARKIGFVPMVFWGMGGTPIPFRSPMTVVVGRPIAIEKMTKNPSREEVAALHAQFLHAMEELFIKHRKEAGYDLSQLKVL